jgi:hypothetical protein
VLRDEEPECQEYRVDPESGWIYRNMTEECQVKYTQDDKTGWWSPATTATTSTPAGLEVLD